MSSTKQFKRGDRVIVNQTSGFHKGAKGVVEFAEPTPQPDRKIWVARDGSGSAAYFFESELDLEVTANVPINKWDYRFLRLAREVSAWSKDPSTKVGAVLVSPDKMHISLGYNGFPKDMEDKPEWLENREEKYSRVIHAEKNAKSNAACSVEGWTQYTWPFASCDRCFVEMADDGIARFVSPIMTPEIEVRWGPIVAKSRQYAIDMKRQFDEVDFPTTFPKEIE